MPAYDFISLVFAQLFAKHGVFTLEGIHQLMERCDMLVFFGNLIFEQSNLLLVHRRYNFVDCLLIHDALVDG